MPFIPHTESEIRDMLNIVGVSNIEELFDEIPATLRAQPLTSIPEGMTELEVTNLMHERSLSVQQGVSFLGAGAYEHHIPAAVWDIVSRGEFYTPYTPYQAEASQGSLQILYEFQTMMASLMGLDCSNASLYEGASALAEAILMAIRCNPKSKSRRILVPRALHPHYLQTIKSIVRLQNIEIVTVDFVQDSGRIDFAKLQQHAAGSFVALVIAQPNFFGVLEDVDALTDWAHSQQAYVIATVNPLAMTMLKEPGAWGQQGVQIACGEVQPFGIPLASGGPYAGFITCRMADIRQLPGRIIGRTVDAIGNPGFSLTLQAREQHIRRAKATSNICTNQGLLVTAATIHMSIMGFDGLARVARQSHHNLLQLVALLRAIPGVKIVFNANYFHEVVVQLPCPVLPVLERMQAKNIFAGLSLQPYYSDLPNTLLVCCTETKTPQQLTQFATALTQELAAC